MGLLSTIFRKVGSFFNRPERDDALKGDLLEPSPAFESPSRSNVYPSSPETPPEAEKNLAQPDSDEPAPTPPMIVEAPTEAPVVEDPLHLETSPPPVESVVTAEPVTVVEPLEAAAVTGEGGDLSLKDPAPAPVALERKTGELGHPSSNGAYCAYEPGDNGGPGVFGVYSSSSECLFETSLSSNVYNTGLSPDGSMAAVQLTMSAGPDSNHLMLIDVTHRRVVFSVNPETRWADAYQFKEHPTRLVVVLEGVGSFDYDEAGKCLDQHYFHDPAFNSGKFSELIPAAEVLLTMAISQKDQAKAHIALKMAIKARSLGADKDFRWNPAALKVQGLAHEALGNNQEALDCLLKAASLNPRLGIKRKIESLSTKLKS
jgi:hypothetical protein